MILNQDKIDKIFMEIYKEMYERSTPKGDIEKIMKSGEGKKSGWFMKYYLPMDKQEEIIKRVCKKYKVSARDSHSIYGGVMLGCSPNSYKGDKNEKRTRK